MTYVKMVIEKGFTIKRRDVFNVARVYVECAFKHTIKANKYFKKC